MELIKCPACGNMVSPRATSCPQCGEPLSSNNINPLADPPKKKSFSPLFVIIPALVIILGVAAFFLFGSGSEKTFTANDVTFKMIKVKGGEFTMGATPEQGKDAWDAEKPTHSVTLSDYYIGETEVTQELWKAVMGDNPSEFKGFTKPVENVSWEDCQEFIYKLNKLTGENFRLPTEAEWEYAARGGKESQGFKYSGDNKIEEVAWYDDNSGEKTHQVATKQPNELGIYDMSGNVWEWCNDWAEEYTYHDQIDPQGPSDGSGRVCRGGSWGGSTWYCRVSNRSYGDPTDRGGALGLRLAL